MADSANAQTNWLALVGKLTAVAINLFRKQGLVSDQDSESVLKGLGKSPSDFVTEALKEVFLHRERYATGSDGELFAIAVTILKRDFSDAVANHAYKTSRDVLDEDLLEQAGPRSTNPLTAIEAEDLAKKFYKFAGEDKDLIDVIDAAAYLAVHQTAQVTRADIADLLSISPEEVTKRNNRLKTRFHADDGRSANG